MENFHYRFIDERTREAIDDIASINEQAINKFSQMTGLRLIPRSRDESFFYRIEKYPMGSLSQALPKALDVIYLK